MEYPPPYPSALLSSQRRPGWLCEKGARLWRSVDCGGPGAAMPQPWKGQCKQTEIPL